MYVHKRSIEGQAEGAHDPNRLLIIVYVDSFKQVTQKVKVML